MVRSVYVMPLTGAGVKGDPRRPKYKDSLFPTLDWSMYDYGDEPQCLVGIQDVPAATNTALLANSDVFAPPGQNLDVAVGSTSTRNAIRTQLEADEIPGNWVQNTTTYREIIRVVGACCQFAQRYQGLVGGRWFSGTVHIGNTFSTLNQQQQLGIRDTAASFGFDQTAIVGTATIRDVLKNMADQYIAAGMPLDLEGPL